MTDSVTTRLFRLSAAVLIPLWDLEYSFNERLWEFHGHNPLTGVQTLFVFNEPAPGRSKVISWNHLMEAWFYSEDAGLTWKRVEGDELIKCMEMADVMYPSRMRDDNL